MKKKIKFTEFMFILNLNNLFAKIDFETVNRLRSIIEPLQIPNLILNQDNKK